MGAPEEPALPRFISAVKQDAVMPALESEFSAKPIIQAVDFL
jgi:hypothetical protein